jgi:hypothetical protein
MCVLSMNKKITEALGYRQQESDARPKINDKKAKVREIRPKFWVNQRQIPTAAQYEALRTALRDIAVRCERDA